MAKTPRISSSLRQGLLRWLLLVLMALFALELFFAGRIALMRWVAPASTTFQRSELWRLTLAGPVRWSQQWDNEREISDNLRRAVIASEDGDFVNHDGVEWEAIEKAWQKNAKAEEAARKQAEVEAARLARQSGRARAPDKPAPIAAVKVKAPKIVGGSTITQQLAKNLLLSGERNLLRKGQELALTLLLETLLDKRQILTLYLNHVEWGEGVFGAEAAARHYYRKSAAQLSPYEAARLAVMLPRPRYFEKLPNSAYLSSRAQTIVARMRDAELP